MPPLCKRWESRRRVPPEIRVVQASRNQMPVAAPQIGSLVIVRTAEGHGQKRLLTGDLAIHVDSVEK